MARPLPLDNTEYSLLLKRILLGRTKKEIRELTDINDSTLSEQVKKLKNHKIITIKREGIKGEQGGSSVYYDFDPVGTLHYSLVQLTEGDWFDYSFDYFDLENDKKNLVWENPLTNIVDILNERNRKRIIDGPEFPNATLLNLIESLKSKNSSFKDAYLSLSHAKRNGFQKLIFEFSKDRDENKLDAKRRLIALSEKLKEREDEKYTLIEKNCSPAFKLLLTNFFKTELSKKRLLTINNLVNSFVQQFMHYNLTLEANKLSSLTWVETERSLFELIKKLYFKNEITPADSLYHQMAQMALKKETSKK